MASKGKSKSRGSTSTVSVTELLKKVDISVDPTDQTIHGIRYAMRHIKRVATECLILMDDDDERKELFKDLTVQMLKLVRSEINHLASPIIIDQVVESMPKCPSEDDLVRDPVAALDLLESSNIINSCDEISTKAQEKLKVFDENLKEKDLKKHPFYLELLEDIARINADKSQQNEEVEDVSQEDETEDDSDTDVDLSAMDLENPGSSRRRDKAAEEMIPVFDPITKQALTDPVRNSRCNHIYGKASILGLISTNPRLRCPTVGCGNREFIREEHLVQDKGLIQKVKKKQAEFKGQKKKEKEKEKDRQEKE